MIDKMRMSKAKDAREAMLNAEILLAYDPGNRDRIRRLLEAARAAELPAAITWVEAIWEKEDER